MPKEVPLSYLHSYKTILQTDQVVLDSFPIKSNYIIQNQFNNLFGVTSRIISCKAPPVEHPSTVALEYHLQILNSTAYPQALLVVSDELYARIITLIEQQQKRPVLDVRGSFGCLDCCDRSCNGVE